jgi:hypothetical protein
MSSIEYNPSLNDRVNGQLGDLGVEIQIPLSSIKELIVPPAPPAPVAPYKVYTALVTQSGSDDPQSIDTGSLTIGVTYKIAIDSPGMDFTNVGAPNNNIDTYFVATGTTPASWGSNEGDGNNTLSYNTGAPTVIVLGNTIGNIWFTYVASGDYYINSNGLFINEKTFALIGTTGFTGGGYGDAAIMLSAPPNVVEIIPADGNGVLASTPIEIRVYN